MNYWELAAWIAAAVCLVTAARYRRLYLIGKQEIRVYNQLITRIDTAFGHMHLSLFWRPAAGQWQVRDEAKEPAGDWIERYEAATAGGAPRYPEQLAQDPNWTIALQNAVNLKMARRPPAGSAEPAR